MENYRLYNIENNINLLLDNDFIDDIWQLRRSPELPVKSYRNPIIYDDPPFEPGGCTIIYDENEELFKCWYGVFDQDLYYAGLPGAYKICYAQSDNGIKWNKPTLRLFQHNNSYDNNLVFINPGSVYKDKYEVNPIKRYKMLYLGDNNIGLCAAFSSDGIHWNKNMNKDVEIIFGSNDTSNAAFYDPKLKKYIRYGRVNVLASIEKEESLGVKLKTSPDIIRYTDIICPTNPYRTTPPIEDFPSYNDYIKYNEAEDYINRYIHIIPYEHATVLRKRGGSGCNRRIVRAESDDFINWSIPELVLAPDELDPSRFYGMTVCIYEGMYIGLLQVYNSFGSGRRNVGYLRYGEGDTIDIQLAFSRDGIHWQRLSNRPDFIPRGYIGSYDGGMIFGQNVPLVEYNNELLFYYVGTVASHTASLYTKSSICVAKLPKGRLISRCAGDEMGALITKPFLMNYDKLSLNLDSTRGVARVEVTDIIGNPLEGFKAIESDELKLNSLDANVSWNGNNSLKSINGKVVRLRIYLWQAKLYSINFN